MNTIDQARLRESDFGGLLDAFRPISLEEMDGVRLLNRIDTKFSFNRSLLPEILEEMKRDYSILDIGGRRISRYETVYFDTDSHLLYMHHHNGKLNRFKVRFRKYVDSGDTFFEIKRKNNKGRMIKDRIPVPGLEEAITGATGAFLSKKTRLDPACLKPALTVQYSRMTFVGNHTPERITIDTEMFYRLDSRELILPHLVIAESKQSKTAHSPFADVMHHHHIRNISLSKYCLGIASLNDHIRLNNFKNKIHYINLINHVTQ